jgi:hypothetical protein
LNPVRWKYLAAAFLLASVVFLVGTLTLPQVRSPQQVTYHGPSVSYFNSTTALSGYYIPTVEKGSQVNIKFSNFVPNEVEISVFPTQPGNIAPVQGAVPVFGQTLVTNFTLSFKALATQPYGVFVVSYDNTSYVMRVQAVYSPYYWLANYEVIGVIATLCSMVLLYYYNFTATRWTKEQREIRDATGVGRAQLAP